MSRILRAPLEKRSSVSFQCEPSAKESAGTELGSERYEMLERLLVARTPIETIALAMKVTESGMAEIMQKLKQSDGIDRTWKRKKVRCVRRLSTTDSSKPADYSQETSHSGSEGGSEFQNVVKNPIDYREEQSVEDSKIDEIKKHGSSPS